MSLIEYGWNESWAAVFGKIAVDGQMPARVVNEQKGLYKLVSESGELYGEVSGKFRYAASGYEDYPSVGDWVAVDMREPGVRTIIHAVLPIKSKFSRKVAGALTQEQVVASNFDYVFILNSLNFDFNPRRLERYLTMRGRAVPGQSLF